MRRLLLFGFLFLSVNTSNSQDYNDCRFYIYCGPIGGRSRSSAQSLPSTSSAASLNPGNIATVKGVGLETLFQVNNPVLFSLVTGNGKIGALISPSLENSFFGNRSIELDSSTFKRQTDKLRYKNTKLNLALGLSLVNRKNVSLDLGVSAKRHPDIKKLNPGIGASARFFLFNFGVYFYKDDVQVDLQDEIDPYRSVPYNALYGVSVYHEKFEVLTYTLGAKIKNWSFDTGVIKTKYSFYPDETLIHLYSTSFNQGKFLFNLAYRQEWSSNSKYINRQMLLVRKKNDLYFGTQYLYNKHLLLGLQHNNFLLNEWSGTITLFF